MTDRDRLQIESLSKSYRRRKVLDSIHFTAAASEAIAIIGPNGAGKSTLLGCITGDRLPDSGRIRICGIDPFEDPPAAANFLGFVPEQPFLYGELTVGEFLHFVAGIRRLDASVAEGEIERLLELMGLTAAVGTFCRELSQGMARKVAIIAALLHGPSLLVLDEVFNGLDLHSTDRFLAELDARRTEGAAILLSSHDLELLARWCDRGLLLAPDGWSVLDGADWERWRESPRLLLA